MSSVLTFTDEFVFKPLGFAFELNAEVESNFVEKHPEVSATFKQLSDAWNLRALAPAVRQKLQAELIANFFGIEIQVVLASDWLEERLKARSEDRKPKRSRAETFGIPSDSDSVILLEGIPVREGSTPTTQFELFSIPKALTEVVFFPAVDLIEGGNACGFDTTIRHFLSSKNVAITRAFIDGKKLLLQYYDSERLRGEQRRLKKAGDAKKRSDVHRKVGGAGPSRVSTASGGGVSDSDDDMKSFSDSLAANSVVQVFTKDVPVLKREFIRLDSGVCCHGPSESLRCQGIIV